MQTHHILDQTTQQCFDNECERIEQQHDPAVTIDHAHALLVVYQLMDQVGQLQCQSAHQWETCIRQQVIEWSFVSEGGDAVVDQAHQFNIDEEVELVAKVLQQACREVHLAGSSGP